MRSLSLIHTLLEYDIPQVFVGMDVLGGRFVCMLSDITDGEPIFLCVPISDRRLKELLTSKLDLRCIYEDPESPEFYLCSPSNLLQPFEIQLASYKVVSKNLLPDPGLYFDQTDEVLNKAQELNTTVAYASLSVPESVNEPRIRTRKLSEFLAIYQGVLKNLAKAVAKTSGKPIPKDEAPYESDVFGFCYGSFTVQVRSSDACDILGENKALTSAFSKLNEFLDLADDPENAMHFLLSIKGHAAASIINLLTFISENDCQLTNRWSTPGMSGSSMGRIRVVSAQKIIQRCRQREDLGTEVLELIGVVDSADVTAKTWKIIVGGVPHSGTVHEGSNLNLAGITLGNKYKFKCEEKIEMVLGTGREVKRLNLTRFEVSED